MTPVEWAKIEKDRINQNSDHVESHYQAYVQRREIYTKKSEFEHTFCWGKLAISRVRKLQMNLDRLARQWRW
eukprot:scaffold6302_cov83-Skeletonema_marinoi.AAC.2